MSLQSIPVWWPSPDQAPTRSPPYPDSLILQPLSHWYSAASPRGEFCQLWCFRTRVSSLENVAVYTRRFLVLFQTASLHSSISSSKLRRSRWSQWRMPSSWRSLWGRCESGCIWFGLAKPQQYSPSQLRVIAIAALQTRGNSRILCTLHLVRHSQSR